MTLKIPIKNLFIKSTISWSHQSSFLSSDQHNETCFIFFKLKKYIFIVHFNGFPFLKKIAQMIEHPP